MGEAANKTLTSNFRRKYVLYILIPGCEESDDGNPPTAATGDQQHDLISMEVVPALIPLCPPRRPPSHRPYPSLVLWSLSQIHRESRLYSPEKIYFFSRISLPLTPAMDLLVCVAEVWVPGFGRLWPGTSFLSKTTQFIQ